ncbi:hypothetical protein WMY93_002196 [Mugilogobius chulae]|uniref:Apolipoprotein L3 n=1 Tax=Mugilogobius chulae TaxID=88201 RepID=A0AAW0Q1E6_9GOBI
MRLGVARSISFDDALAVRGVYGKMPGCQRYRCALDILEYVQTHEGMTTSDYSGETEFAKGRGSYDTPIYTSALEGHMKKTKRGPESGLNVTKSGLNNKESLQVQLQKYISQTYDDIRIIRDFTNRSDQWEQARRSEIKALDQSDLSELEMGAVLEKTLIGLKELQSFLEAVERLVVTSEPVFKQNSVVELPQQIPGLLLSSDVLAPLLLLFKRDNEEFFKAKVPNKTVFEMQLESYITTAKILWEGLRHSDLDAISLDPPQIQLEDLSEGNAQVMLFRITKLLQLREDKQFSALGLFHGITWSFRQKVSNLKPQIERCLEELETCAKQLDSMNHGARISGTVSSSAGIVGGILCILGVIGAPFTAGTSAFLTAAGVGIGGVSGVQGLVTTVVETKVNQTQNDKAKKEFDKCIRMINEIQRSVNDVIHQHFEGINVELLKEVLVQYYNGAVLANNLAGAVSLIVEKLKEGEMVVNTAYDVSEGVVAVTRTASTALKWAKMLRVGSGVVNGVLAGVDGYFLYSDIKSLTGGTETEASKWIRARSGLCRVEIESWQKLSDLIGEDERRSDKRLLKKPFYP